MLRAASAARRECSDPRVILASLRLHLGVCLSRVVRPACITRSQARISHVHLFGPGQRADVDRMRWGSDHGSPGHLRTRVACEDLRRYVRYDYGD